MLGVRRRASSIRTHTVIGYQVDRQRRQTPLETQPLNLLNGAALVVLVDHDSASGAEILAAALQEAKIGHAGRQQTAGNVGVATQITLPDELGAAGDRTALRVARRARSSTASA